jgi:ComF family protein
MMKFEQRLAAARTLGSLLTAFIAECAPQPPDAIVPVPLHPRRLRQRGFNQALEIARPVARFLGVPLETGAVQRIKPTRPQSELKGLRERRSNLHRAFAYRQTRGNWLNVAVVDDVMTTGTTTEELTRVLLDHGVERVSIWTCARAAA